MKFKNQQNTKIKVIKGLSVGVITTILAMVILSMIFATMINTENVSISYLTIGTTSILIISVMVGNLFSISLIGEKKLLISGVHAAVILACIAIGNMLLGDGLSTTIGKGSIAIAAATMASYGISLIKLKNKYNAKRRYC